MGWGAVFGVELEEWGPGSGEGLFSGHTSIEGVGKYFRSSYLRIFQWLMIGGLIFVRLDGRTVCEHSGWGSWWLLIAAEGWAILGLVWGKTIRQKFL